VRGKRRGESEGKKQPSHGFKYIRVNAGDAPAAQRFDERIFRRRVTGSASGARMISTRRERTSFIGGNLL